MAESKFISDRRRPEDSLERRFLRTYDPRQVQTGGSHSLRDRPLIQGEPPLPASAPPRGAVMAVGAPTPAPSAPIGPNPGKEKARADLQSIATATVIGYSQGEGPRGQAGDQTVPADTATPPMPKHGTGPGADAATPPRAAGGTVPGPSPLFVKLEDGRVISGNNLTPYLQAGGHNISFQDAMARPDKPEMALGKPQAERFMRGRTSLLDAPPPQPYSEQVRALANTDAPNVNAPGSDWKFSGGGAVARTGTHELSGLEQALARRTWLEGRADTEQRQESARAEVDRRTRLSEMDPLELARIQAQGRMGGDVAKVELDLRARQAAKVEFEKVSSQIELMMDRLKAAAPGSEDAAQAKQYIDYLIQTRRELSNIILGERLTDPRGVGDALGAAIAGLGLAGGGAAPTTGAR